MVRKNEFASSVDSHVGSTIQELRIVSGLSRHQLADKLSISHQQLQKYESGENRISAGRLYMLARALGKDVNYFFNDFSRVKESKIPEEARLAIEASRNFVQIKTYNQRNAVNNLMKALIKDV